MPQPLTGLIAAPHTPFDAGGALAGDVVEVQAAHLAAAGVSGVFVAGSTEGPSLTPGERRESAERWVRAGRGHGLTVVVHCGSDSLPEATGLAAHAAAAGADAVAALAPRYYKPATLEVLVDWCARIARAAPALPFFYYDIPALTGVQFPMSAFLDAAADRVPTLAGLKYTNADALEYQRCLRAAGGALDVLWGTDEAMLAGLALGARGFVGSTYNFAAPVYRRVQAAFEAGEMETARREQMRSVELVAALMGHGFLPACKALMGMLGVDCGPPRAPLAALDEGRRAALRADLEALGFFDWVAAPATG